VAALFSCASLGSASLAAAGDHRLRYGPATGTTINVPAVSGPTHADQNADTGDDRVEHWHLPRTARFEFSFLIAQRWCSQGVEAMSAAFRCTEATAPGLGSFRDRRAGPMPDAITELAIIELAEESLK
jgi:hypothetical protein